MFYTAHYPDQSGGTAVKELLSLIQGRHQSGDKNLYVQVIRSVDHHLLKPGHAHQLPGDTRIIQVPELLQEMDTISSARYLPPVLSWHQSFRSEEV